MATYLIICIVLIAIAVAFDAISNLVGNLVETVKQIAWQRRERIMTTRQELLAQVSQLSALVVSLKGRLESLEDTQFTPAVAQCAPTVDMGAVQNVPWFDGDDAKCDATDINTIVDVPRFPAPAAQRTTPPPIHRSYRIPRRFGNYMTVPNYLYTWQGRQGQSVYGVSLCQTDDGVVQCQIVDSVSLKPKSRCVPLPHHARRLESPAVPAPTSGSAAPTSPQTEPVDTTPKPFIAYKSKRSNLIARDDSNQFVVSDASDTAHTVRMIRKGYVPVALTNDELNSLINANPKYWPHS